MKTLTFTFILTLFTACLFAQTKGGVDTSLKFNQRYTKLERKWVVLSKKDTAKTYTFGYIYIDAAAGFTFDLQGAFSVTANGSYVRDTAIFKNSGSIKYRIAPNWQRVALLDAKHFAELNIKPEPDWVKIYYSDADSLRYKFRLGFLYNDVGESALALPYLTEAYKRSPHYPGLEFELIFAYNALERYDDAITVIEAAIKHDPKDPLFYRELGYAYYHKKIYDKSITYYKQGLELCKTDDQKATKAEIAINMASAYKFSGNQEEFLNWGKKAKEWATAGTPLYNFIVSQGFKD